MHEFELIQRYFSRAPHGEGVMLGVGDDAALLQVPPGQTLAVSVDTLVAGVHFPADAPAQEIAQRALRVNLSDLAAMGAKPAWFTLALTLPEVNEPWLADFSRGLYAAADEFSCALVGGDTTAGPLSVTVQVMGFVSAERALRRSGAGVGDTVFVTHCLGDGAAGLAVVEGKMLQGATALDENHKAYLRQRFYRPQPRVREGQLLAGLASAAQDISDGLLADLGHICNASGVGAELELTSLPLSPALQALNDSSQVLPWALSGGDDYELCFTLPAARLAQLNKMITGGLLQATAIGKIVAGSGVRCLSSGQPVTFDARKYTDGYRHFS